MGGHRVIVSGSMAQRPRHGGHTWVFLQYLLGFRSLGWDVLFLDRIDPATARDVKGRPTRPADCTAAAFLQRTLGAFGLGSSYAALVDGTSETVGLDRRRVLEFARSCDLLLDIMGFCADEEVLAAARRRVFVDIDPGFPQMWHALGLHDAFSGYDAFATVGTNLGAEDCRAPAAGIDWTPIAPPVAVEFWDPVADVGPGFTTIATWRGPFGPIEYDGATYGLRVHEFRKFFPLPGLADQRFEVALDIDPADSADLDAIRAHGWVVSDPRTAASDPWRYRDFIRRSGAEFSVAKNLYVQARTGWFSDRSACYLASGKPVLTQDTGFGDAYPTGEGLVTYRTLEEAVQGAEAIASDLERHGRAARALAREYLDAGRVLPRLVEAVAA